MEIRGITVEEGQKKIDSAIKHLESEFTAIRSGRIMPGILDNLTIEMYNSTMSINQLGNVSVADAATLVIRVWDTSGVKAIEKAIREDDRGFSIRIDGNNLYVSAPPLTEERRKEYVKTTKELAEDTRQQLRGFRNKMMDRVRDQLAESEISEDDEKLIKADIEKLIKTGLTKIEELTKQKEADLMGVK
ncbi:ribosome recycling factor [Candidatus Dojkabacteria bacterium]|nr:ribosome recycling factor [Candidatus Dojkabacteria bacterium]